MIGNLRKNKFRESYFQTVDIAAPLLLVRKVILWETKFLNVSTA